MKAEDDSLARTILHTLNIAVLRRTGPRQYVFYGQVPEFYAQLFPADTEDAPDAAGAPDVPAAEAPCTRPWVHSSMLEYFFEDAELFFTRNLPGSINSGAWQEDGSCDGEQALFAQAIIADGAQFLTIRLLREDFSERLHVLRKAREHLLERRILTSDLERYQHKSRVDGLTQVLNKTTFIERLGAEIECALENNTPLSLAIIDIDSFKQVNDTYGHLCGDHVLATLGDLLRQTVRRNDIVARFGGEEFVVLTPCSTLGQCHHTAEKLRKTTERHNFSQVPRITVSIGCTTYVSGESWENFLQRADIALYDAKTSGKNVVKVR